MAGAQGAPKSRSRRNNKALLEAKRERSRGQPQMLLQDLLPADGPAVVDDALSVAPEQPGEWGARRVSPQPGPWIGCAATSLGAAEAPLQRPGLGRSQVGKEWVQHLDEVPYPDSFPSHCDASIWSCQRRAEPQSKVWPLQGLLSLMHHPTMGSAWQCGSQRNPDLSSPSLKGKRDAAMPQARIYHVYLSGAIATW